MFKDILAELDDIASTLQQRGFNRLAARTDMVTNTLETHSQRVPTRRKADIGDNKGLSQGGSFKGPPPGSDDADEAGHSDQFVAEHYHRVPVGKDSVSRMLGAPSVADMLSRLDFADEGKINVQASRRQAADDGNFDEGDPIDPWTTAGLPESGDESAEPPVDIDQEGDVLPFLGTEEEGSLHMPEGSGGGSESEIDRLLEQAEEQDVTTEPGMMGRESSRARQILQSHARQAADVEVSQPGKLLNHPGDPQEDVMDNFPWIDGEADNDPITASVDEDEDETPGVYAGRAASRRARRSGR